MGPVHRGCMWGLSTGLVHRPCAWGLHIWLRSRGLYMVPVSRACGWGLLLGIASCCCLAILQFADIKQGALCVCIPVPVWVYSVSCCACHDEPACQYQTCILLILNTEFLVNSSHQLVLITSLPFVHTARRSYRLSDPVNNLDCCIAQLLTLWREI